MTRYIVAVKEAVGDGLEVQGPIASNEVIAGNPIQFGGHASNASPTGGSDGDLIVVHVSRTGEVMTVQNTHGPIGDASQAQGGAIRQHGTNVDRALAVLGYALAPDGSTDRLRSLGDTAGAGLGVLAAAPWIPGASDVKAARQVTASDSTTAVSLVAPTAGKKIRIISVFMVTDSATVVSFEMYFHATAGGSIGTDETKYIAEARLDDGVEAFFSHTFPDGGGPVGAADDDITVRTSGNITTSGFFGVTYREE